MENILQKIELNSSHPNNLILIPLPKTTSGKQSYKLRLNDASTVDDELFISINSPLTQQSIKIPILPESYSEKLVNYNDSWVTNIMSNVGKIIAIFVLVLTTIALVLMCQRNRDLDTSGSKLHNINVLYWILIILDIIFQFFKQAIEVNRMLVQLKTRMFSVQLHFQTVNLEIHRLSN